VNYARFVSLMDRLTPVVNVAVLIVSILAGIIALVALHHADESGRETTAALTTANASLSSVVTTLDASRKALDSANAGLLAADDALQAMKASAASQARAETAATKSLESELGIANQQVVILRDTLATASKQYQLALRQYQGDLARENARPNIEMSFSGIPSMREGSSVVLLVEQQKNLRYFRLKLLLRNVGTAPLISATVNVSAQPESVYVEQVTFLGTGGIESSGVPTIFTAISPFGRRGSHPPDCVVGLIVNSLSSSGDALTHFALTVSVAGIGGAFTRTFYFAERGK
jgi:hypothetical protein